MIIINPIPGQEEENAEFLESHGVGIWIRKHVSHDEIFKEIFSTPEKLQQMKENTSKLAKKHSTEDICKIFHIGRVKCLELFHRADFPAQKYGRGFGIEANALTEFMSSRHIIS